MAAIICILAFVGISFGSFANVCIFRYPRGIPLVMMPSFCPGCRQRLHWVDLIPVVSFLVLQGQCRTCHTPIPLRYPLVELAFGACVVLSFLAFGFGPQFLVSIAFLFLMLVIAAIDWLHLIIPNQVVLTGFVLGSTLNLIFDPDAGAMRFLSSLVALALTFGVLVLGGLIFRRPALGMGDVKLAGVIGLFLGLRDFLVSLWLAALIGTLFHILMTLLRRQQMANPMRCRQASAVLPFGTFLAVASSGVTLFSSSIEQLVTSWLILMR